jgi:hypothetical protein
LLRFNLIGILVSFLSFFYVCFFIFSFFFDLQAPKLGHFNGEKDSIFHHRITKIHGHGVVAPNESMNTSIGVRMKKCRPNYCKIPEYLTISGTITMVVPYGRITLRRDRFVKRNNILKARRPYLVRGLPRTPNRTPWGYIRKENPSRHQ